MIATQDFLDKVRLALVQLGEQDPVVLMNRHDLRVASYSIDPYSDIYVDAEEDCVKRLLKERLLRAYAELKTMCEKRMDELSNIEV